MTFYRVIRYIFFIHFVVGLPNGPSDETFTEKWAVKRVPEEFLIFMAG